MSPTHEFSKHAASLRGRRTRRRRTTLLVLLLVVSVPVALALWRVGSPPELELQTDRPGIGPSTTVQAMASESHRGLGTVRLSLIQGDSSWELASVQHEPRPFWAFWGPKKARENLVVEVRGDEIDGLSEGDALLRLEASRAPTWLRRPAATVLERPLQVNLRPPSLSALSQPNYVAQGGSGVVVYSVSEDAVRHGVAVGDLFFAGATHPDDPQRRFSLFVAPYDFGEDRANEVRLIAEDALGNAAERRFLTTFRGNPLSVSTIQLNDRFLEKVVPEIASETPGITAGDDLLSTYLEINGDLRRTNAERLRELAQESQPAFLWRGSFLEQPGAQVMDRFAARRTYRYQGRDVDTQDHLGLDLASVRQAPVVASNSGRVVLAEYFGIYGRTVVLDHGFGLMSLYAHLSSTDVEVGDEVDRGAALGRTGATGLAGGDHLHFTVLVGGEPTNPLEWFDASWVRNRIQDPLAR